MSPLARKSHSEAWGRLETFGRMSQEKAETSIRSSSQALRLPQCLRFSQGAWLAARQRRGEVCLCPVLGPVAQRGPPERRGAAQNQEHESGGANSRLAHWVPAPACQTRVGAAEGRAFMAGCLRGTGRCRHLLGGIPLVPPDFPGCRLLMVSGGTQVPQYAALRRVESWDAWPQLGELGWGHGGTRCVSPVSPGLPCSSQIAPLLQSHAWDSVADGLEFGGLCPRMAVWSVASSSVSPRGSRPSRNGDGNGDSWWC